MAREVRQLVARDVLRAEVVGSQQVGLHGGGKLGKFVVIIVGHNLVMIQGHPIETYIAEGAIAEVDGLAVVVTGPDEHVMGVGDEPVTQCGRPVVRHVQVMVNSDFIVGTVHHKGKVCPFSGGYRYARINGKRMSRGGSGGVETQRLTLGASAEKLIAGTFVAGTLHGHVAFADIARRGGIGLVAHPAGQGKALAGGNVEVAVMRDAHVLVGAVEGDVVGRLRQGSDSHHHQGKEGKGLFHGVRC